MTFAFHVSRYTRIGYTQFHFDENVLVSALVTHTSFIDDNIVTVTSLTIQDLLMNSRIN